VAFGKEKEQEGFAGSGEREGPRHKAVASPEKQLSSLTGPLSRGNIRRTLPETDRAAGVLYNSGLRFEGRDRNRRLL
jgi:hypothetical protein